MSHDFETATASAGDLQQRLELFMSTCQRCGRCFTAPTPLEALKLTGYRFDDLEKERWVRRALARLDGAPGGGDLTIELEEVPAAGGGIGLERAPATSSPSPIPPKEVANAP